MPTPSRAKPPLSAWIVRERKRLGLKPPDLAERLTAAGLPVQVGTVRTWEAGRKPHPDNIEGLERIFGTRAPASAPPEGDTLAGGAALIDALSDQTAAINALVLRLDELLPSERVREMLAWAAERMPAESRSPDPKRDHDGSPARS